MTATAVEKYAPYEVDGASLGVGWWVYGTDDFAVAEYTLRTTAPPLLGIYPMTGMRLTPTEIEDRWDGTVTYGTPPGQSQQPWQGDTEPDPTFSIDIGTATAHITQSLSTPGAYKMFAAGAVTDNKNVIGGKEDGSVDGVDKLVPQCMWTEHHYLPKSRVNRAYFNMLYNLVAKMNAAEFRTFDRGEVLFMGGSLTKRYSSKWWEAQFKFFPSPNATGLTVGDISFIDKLGHDYLWVRYRQAVDATANSLPPLPFEVFVERIYEFGDYSQMKLQDPF